MLSRTLAVALLLLSTSTAAAQTLTPRYVRDCGPFGSDPIVAGDRLYACDAIFDVASGRYLGVTPGEELGALLAVTPHGSLHHSPDDALVRVQGGRVVARASGAEPLEVVVSPSGRLAASTDGRSAVRVFALPSLQQRFAIESSACLGDLTIVGFTIDEVLLGSCPTREGAALVQFEATGMRAAQHLPALCDAAAVSPSGDVVACANRGTLRVVDAHTGATIATTRVLRDAEHAAVADGGSQVALTGLAGERGEPLVVFARREASLERVHVELGQFTRAITFAGPRLFALRGYDLSMFEPGAPAASSPGRPTLPAVPASARPARLRNGTIEFNDFATEIAPAGFLAAFRLEDGDQLVYRATDAQEIDAASLERWGNTVARRFYPVALDNGANEGVTSSIRTLRDARGRRVLVVRWASDGCDPHDHYARVTEVDGQLVHATLSVLRGEEPEPAMMRLLEMP